jgi:hypothetical protein
VTISSTDLNYIINQLKQRGLVPPTQNVWVELQAAIKARGTLVSAFLAAVQRNSTLTPAALTGHTFTLAPGQSLQLTGHVVCTSAVDTTGFAVSLRVVQGSEANAPAIGSGYVEVAETTTPTSAAVFDADTFSVAAGNSQRLTVVGSATTDGRNGAAYQVVVKNTAARGSTTVQIEFRSEVDGSQVTAQIGSGCVGVKG